GIATDATIVEPLWSPDGTAYLEHMPGDWSNWVLHRADGAEIKTLPSPVMWGPWWSPDSRKITFVVTTFPTSTLEVFDVQGQERTDVTTTDNLGFWRQHGSPLSPDGELIACTIEPASGELIGQHRVVVYDMTGTERVRFEGWGLTSWRPQQ
ncbi:MAG TPA: hypothetical protein VFX76_23015, partial [Roseiflexaceae bacterium]|nr:hypothetical protein [Roseiflexaceae bacterium]